MPFVYSIKCKLEPYKEYIGQTVQDDFQVRLNGHMADVNNGRKRHLYNAIRLYGWDQFMIEILHSFPREGNWEERLTNSRFTRFFNVEHWLHTGTITRRVGTRTKCFTRTQKR